MNIFRKKFERSFLFDDFFNAEYFLFVYFRPNWKIFKPVSDFFRVVKFKHETGLSYKFSNKTIFIRIFSRIKIGTRNIYLFLYNHNFWAVRFSHILFKAFFSTFFLYRNSASQPNWRRNLETREIWLRSHYKNCK